MSIWGLGNSVVIQIHLASKLDSQQNHYPINIERRRVRCNVFHKIEGRSDTTLPKKSKKGLMQPFIYANPAPMTQTPGEDSSIFQISRAHLADSAQTTVLRKSEEEFRRQSVFLSTLQSKVTTDYTNTEKL
jgi:hypothetical protein